MQAGLLHQSGNRHVIPPGNVSREGADQKWVAAACTVYLISGFVRGYPRPALCKRAPDPTGAERLKGASRGVLMPGNLRKQLGCLRWCDGAGCEQDRHGQRSDALREIQKTAQARFVGEVGVVEDQHQRGRPGEVSTQHVETVKVLEGLTARVVSASWSEESRGQRIGAERRRLAHLAKHVLKELNNDAESKLALSAVPAGH